MKLKIYTADGKKFAEKEFNNFPVFQDDKGIDSLKRVIDAYLANARQGNACAKTMGEVSGSGKKPYRQKGTGQARHGSRRSPIWSGGGVTHGPRPRDYTKKVNRKEKLLAFSRALFDVAHGNNLFLIEAWTPKQPKTRLFNETLTNIRPEGSVLIVDDVFADDTILAARNIGRLHLCEAATVNAWDLVRYDHVIISEKGLDVVLSRLNS
jgi:large subunit ribosomal protein L4